ncbi:MAG: DUF523 and DUF1722 domain-containing protein [Methanomicrobiales archaeon]|nr:DUF523 and DUF1722 domain-containing protein [Methanomicrobiales archaeon]
MREFIQPRILVSRCIEFEACRYNGAMISSETVKKLQNIAEMYPVCPEMEIGLGVPREPIRLVEKGDMARLIQPATGRDITEEMHTFAEWFLKSLPPLDGFILKDRSPSCGLKNVPIYGGIGESEPKIRGNGLFAQEIVSRFPLIPLANERDLTGNRLRGHFLTQIYTIAEFRAVRNHEITKNLLQFHAENKYLLSAYHRTEYNTLTALATNRSERSFDVVMKEYEEHLLQALSRPPRVTSHLAVLRHALTHFEDASIPPQDREKVKALLEAYRTGAKPLSAPCTLIREWIVKYDEDYLSQQTYFEPYPAVLETSDPDLLTV